MASWLGRQGRLAGRAETAVSLAKRAGLAAGARALSRVEHAVSTGGELTG